MRTRLLFLLMVGSIVTSLFFTTCTEKNKEPICEIVKPADNDTIQVGDILTITAEATDEDGNIIEVRFYVDDTGVGSSDIFPYTYNWDSKDADGGKHSIKVVAKDDDGAEGTDEISIIILGKPTKANAGSDQTFTDGTTTTTILSANEPEPWQGTGKWSVVSGEGGSFVNDTVPNTTFTGLMCTSYTLRWTISTNFDISYDEVRVSFLHTPTVATVGSDQTFTDGTVTATLSANTPEAEHGTGAWTVVSGTGGSFTDASSPTTTFTGTACTAYTLQWTISTSCSSSSDNVNIEFNQTPTVADAGSDQTFTDGTVTATLAANMPIAQHGTGVWTIISGTGGSFADATSLTTSFTGILHEVYTLRWTISTNCNSSTDDVVISFQQDGAGSSLTDVDGNTYSTVWIGNQVWMAENLKVTHYPDGAAIPHITDNTEWGNLGDNNTNDAYCFYNNDESLGYGALYTYAAAIGDDWARDNKDGQGICPDGWHLPSYAEWTELGNYVENDGHSSKEGIALKTTTGWNNGGNGTDDYGFSALPGGVRYSYDGTFRDVGHLGGWWSSTEDSSSHAYGRGLYYDSPYVYRLRYTKSFGFSVRCLRDSE